MTVLRTFRAAAILGVMATTALMGAQNQLDTSPSGAAPSQAPAPGPAPNGGGTALAAFRQAAASQFQTQILAGGATNFLDVDVQTADLVRLPTVALQWRQPRNARGCSTVASGAPAELLSKAPLEENNSMAVLTVFIPPVPCWWPVYQYARITVTGETAGSGGVQQARVLFDGTIRVSVLWFPLLVTLAVVGFIYPGCAMIAWRLERRRTNRELSGKTIMDVVRRPSLWKKLDPVQITANAWGRASLPKLQIFGFSLIIFGLLLYSQMRNGILSGLSTDVLLLLGISGVGTAAARYTHLAKRRLSLENWAWLRSQQWLPTTEAEKKNVRRRFPSSMVRAHH